MEQLRTSIRYENESKLSMEQQMANKDKLLANKVGTEKRLPVASIGLTYGFRMGSCLVLGNKLGC